MKFEVKTLKGSNLKRAFFTLALIFTLSLFSPLISHAQDYSFSVPANHSNVIINKDGSIGIEYSITFTCDLGAHPIDIVDIGLPNESYDIGAAEAWINNVPVYEIYKSEYIDIGVEVHLGENIIWPGETGTLRFRIDNPKMVYHDDDRDDYASVEFSPTWYGSLYAHGVTDLSVSIHFPPGVGPDETIYHYREYDSWKYDDEGRLTFTWRNTSASPSEQYMFGVSFPKTYVDKIHKPYSKPFILRVEKFILSLLGLIFNPIFILLIIIISMIIRSRMRRMKYFPPAVSIEGVGIKRGLTAPEAALLLELPLNKVITMVIFGLLKKGYARVEMNGKPKVFEIDIPERPDIRGYETALFGALKEDGALDKVKLRKTMVEMIKDVNKKIKGFSRKGTREYYQNIVETAWKHVMAANTPELLGKEWDNKLEWILMDKHYDKKMEETFAGKTIILPHWYGRYWGPGHAGTTLSGGSLKLPGADFANTMVTGIEKFSSKVITNVESFISGVKNVTNPPPAPSKGGGYSGGGCACACACAGCACACAGGGR